MRKEQQAELLAAIKKFSDGFIVRLRDPQTRIAALEELCEAHERSQVEALLRDLDEWGTSSEEIA